VRQPVHNRSTAICLVRIDNIIIMNPHAICLAIFFSIVLCKYIITPLIICLQWVFHIWWHILYIRLFYYYITHYTYVFTNVYLISYYGVPVLIRLARQHYVKWILIYILRTIITVLKIIHKCNLFRYKIIIDKY